MGIFPLGCGFDDETEQATLAYYLKIAKRYIGSPMLSALYGVWAARAGNRRLSLEMLERGYGDFCTGRFMQTLEYRKDVFPEQPPAGPFFANLGGFLLSLILGFPKIQPGPDNPQDWCKGPVILPAGWRSIEIDRIWIRGQPWRLSAVQGAPRTQIAPCAGACQQLEKGFGHWHMAVRHYAKPDRSYFYHIRKLRRDDTDLLPVNCHAAKPLGSSAPCKAG